MAINGRIITTSEVLLRSEVHIRLPSLGVLHQEDKHLEHLNLKANKAYSGES